MVESSKPEMPTGTWMSIAEEGKESVNEKVLAFLAQGKPTFSIIAYFNLLIDPSTLP